ncbi:MAG: hypothetical protein UT22_C0029G0006 [Parcubacteria group bacterium GW2011_GWC2_39_11]|nr:MAG: hypothetical protein UT22_C0029G0006 [Parcubacteria group bacterium GW2011_GWC2_39_11]
MERRQKLSENVSIELSFLRRIKHLSENISDQAWQEKMIDALKEYQKKLSEDFLDRGRVLGSSRRFTHLIYKFEPSNRYEEVIMQDLLSVTRELAQKRQYIEEYLNYRFLPTSWLTLITVGVFIIILLILNREPSVTNQLGTFFGVAVILLCLDFIRQRNGFNKNDVQEYQERYKKNIAKTKE